MKHRLSKKALSNTIVALDEREAIGRIRWAKDGEGRPNLIQFIDDLEGVELQSLWTDFGAVSRTYPKTSFINNSEQVR